MSETKFMTGGEAVVRACVDVGAEVMFGYPITPSTEILHGWIAEAEKNPKLKYLQTEDETAAGFALAGALLAGKRAFTATAGPGTVLMQDPLSMAENLRLPFVTVVMQRGGPSTGTVNYSQQELNLSAFGGNGDGLRVVYSASTVLELYTLVYKSFSTAWKYRFPTFVLGDGHLAKMKVKVALPREIKPVQTSPILKEEEKPTFLRNCFSSEESFYEDRLRVNITDFDNMKYKVAESEQYQTFGAKSLIVAHGSVADACKDAVDILRSKGKKVGLFRAITVHPLDVLRLNPLAKKVDKIFVVEASLNQFARVVKYELSGINVKISEVTKPALAFSAEEIVNLLLKKL